MDYTHGHFTTSTDITRMDIAVIHGYLSQESYWAPGVPLAVVQKSIENSLCFGVFDNETGQQIGFARMITDRATFAYLADVFILPNYRGQGLSKWLMTCILSHPDLQGLRRIILATRDAHGLYAQFGFGPLGRPERWMDIHNPDVYKQA